MWPVQSSGAVGILSRQDSDMNHEQVWKLRMVVLFAFCWAAVTGAAGAQTKHDKEYWKKIAESRYAVPEGEKAFALAKEVSGNLKSADSELRDDLAYSILATWVLRPGVLS